MKGSPMDIGQKLGAAILMMIPTFVGGVLVFEYVHSWLAVIVWLALMPVVYWAIVTGRFSRTKEA